MLEQASQLGVLEVIKQLVERGVTSTSEAVIQASKYGHENLVKFYFDNKYWDKTRLVQVAA